MSPKRALVTGASGGIGLELAKLLAGAGYNLVLAARSEDRLTAAAEQLRAAFGVAIETVAIDLAKAGAAGELAARAPECDVLVNNAGFANSGAFAATPEEAMLDELHLDVVTLTHLTRLYLPGMLQRRSGRILNVASTAAFLPGPHMAVYYASKAYVLSLSEALWEETRSSGVTVTCLCPGATATGFARRAGMESTILMRLPLADAADVAKAGFAGMMRGRRVVVPGLSNKLVAISPRFSPRRLVLWLSRKAVEHAP